MDTSHPDNFKPSYVDEGELLKLIDNTFSPPVQYQMSAAKRKIIGGVGIQTYPQREFLDLPLENRTQGIAQTVVLLRKP
jgi:hypothetical protein